MASAATPRGMSNRDGGRETGMRPAIIMARRRSAAEYPWVCLAEYAAPRRAPCADSYLAHAGFGPASAAARARLERRELPALFPRIHRRADARHHGCAAGKGRRPALPECVASTRRGRGARTA